jgi:hypothetical protein
MPRTAPAYSMSVVMLMECVRHVLHVVYEPERCRSLCRSSSQHWTLEHHWHQPAPCRHEMVVHPYIPEVNAKHRQCFWVLDVQCSTNDTSRMPKGYLSKTDKKAYQKVVRIEL